MLFILSGEGPTDIGGPNGTARHDSGDLLYPLEEWKSGPMAHFVNEMCKESSIDAFNPALGCKAFFVPETNLTEKAKLIRNQSRGFSGQGNGQHYHTKCAFVLATLAAEKKQQEGNSDTVVIFFRDCDGTRSTPQNRYTDLKESMKRGFERARGEIFCVPMIPKPKSEAWLLCALKASPYHNCTPIEERSGNDRSPNSLKEELKSLIEVMGRPYNAETLVDMIISDSCPPIQPNRIDMPSWNDFKQDLKEALDSTGFRNL